MQSPPYRVMRIIARLNIGGPALHTTLLTKRLNQAEFETTLVTGVEGKDEGNMLDLMPGISVQRVVLPGLGREISPLNDLRTLASVRKLMRQSRPQIVHTHTAKAGFVGRTAARLARTPVVIHTFHGNVFKGYFSPAKTKLFIAIERFLAKGTDRIIVLSRQQQDEICSLGIGRPEQFRIIPLGLDLKPFLAAHEMRGQLRAELGIAPDVPLAGIVARLVPIKAIHRFLEAAVAVLKSHPSALFLIVGDGELRAELEAKARELGIAESVRFLGFRSDLPRIYGDLDCSVLCSLNEGLPVAVIEALSAGRPVVATNVGGVPDLIRHDETGYLVADGDVEDLARGISLAFTEPDRAARWGTAGQAHVFPALDISRLVTDIEALYHEVLREKSL